MIIVYILLGILGAYLVVGLLVSVVFHHLLFGKRWMPDGIVRYYSHTDFKGLNAESVEFKRKKTTLRGKLYSYPKDEYKGILVFSHGMWGSHCAYVQEIERLAQAGFIVLGFDYYGTELSDGKNTRSMVESLISLDYAIRYVKSSYPNYDIYVMGHSWGGFAASNILKYHPDIKKVVAMSPFLSVKNLLMSMLPKKFWAFIPFLLLIELIKSGNYSLANTIKTLSNIKNDILIVHSKDDHMVKYEAHTKKLQESNKNINYFIVDGKKHNPDYSDEAINYAIEVNLKMKEMSNEDKLIYRKAINYQLLGKLDDNIISKIVDFLN